MNIPKFWKAAGPLVLLLIVVIFGGFTYAMMSAAPEISVGRLSFSESEKITASLLIGVAVTSFISWLNPSLDGP